MTVRTGFHTWMLGTFRVGAGLVIIPFIVGVIMLFVIPEKLVSKLVTGLGFFIIILSVIMGTEFYFRSTSLYVYLLMLVAIFGGIALVLKVLLSQPKEDTNLREDTNPKHINPSNQKKYIDQNSSTQFSVEEELERMKEKYK